MNNKTQTQLRQNGYGAESDGRLICHRTPEYRYEHEQLGVLLIQIAAGDSKTAKNFIAEVLAAIDEPACLIGISTGLNLAMVLFRTSSRNVKARHDFIFEGKQGLLLATTEAPPFNVGELNWHNDRSPLTVARNALPPLFDDHVEHAVRAVTEFGGRLGSLPTPEEIAAEAARQERSRRFKRKSPPACTRPRPLLRARMSNLPRVGIPI